MFRASASASGIGNWALRPSVSPAAAERAGGAGGAACPGGLEPLAESGAIFSAPGAAVTAFVAAGMRSESAGMALGGGVLRGLGGVALVASGGFGGSGCGNAVGAASADPLVRFRLARRLGALAVVESRSSIIARRLRSMRAVLSITKRLLSPPG